MTHYHKGRTELAQIASPAVVDFCERAITGDVSPRELRSQLVSSLSPELIANLQRSLIRRSYLCFFEQIRDKWPEDAAPPKMFETPNLFWKNPFVVLQHFSEEVAGSNILHVVQGNDGFFVSVSLRSRTLYVSIEGTRGEHGSICADAG